LEKKVVCIFETSDVYFETRDLHVKTHNWLDFFRFNYFRFRWSFFIWWNQTLV